MFPSAPIGGLAPLAVPLGLILPGYIGLAVSMSIQ
jgi:hypothetical protein